MFHGGRKTFGAMPLVSDDAILLADVVVVPVRIRAPYIWVNIGLMHRSNGCRYSITSSARASSDGGTVRPSAFAVLRLIARSIFVGCTTGSSAGRSPLRILPA